MVSPQSIRERQRLEECQKASFPQWPPALLPSTDLSLHTPPPHDSSVSLPHIYLITEVFGTNRHGDRPGRRKQTEPSGFNTHWQLFLEGYWNQLSFQKQINGWIHAAFYRTRLFCFLFWFNCCRFQHCFTFFSFFFQGGLCRCDYTRCGVCCDVTLRQPKEERLKGEFATLHVHVRSAWMVNVHVAHGEPHQQCLRVPGCIAACSSHLPSKWP